MLVSKNADVQTNEDAFSCNFDTSNPVGRSWTRSESVFTGEKVNYKQYLSFFFFFFINIFDIIVIIFYIVDEYEDITITSWT